MTGMHGRRSLGNADQLRPRERVSDRCQICAVPHAHRVRPCEPHSVWGAHALPRTPEWKFINVRRLFLFVEESIDKEPTGLCSSRTTSRSEPTNDTGRHQQRATDLRSRPRARHAGEVRDLPDPGLAILQADVSECSCYGRTSLGLPALELRAQGILTLIHERLDRLRVRDGKDELHVAPAHGLDVDYGGWHPRLGDLCLTDATETLAEQRLNRLDPSTVIRNRDFLTEALPAFRTGARRP